MDENNRQIPTITFTLVNLYSSSSVLFNDTTTLLMHYHHYHCNHHHHHHHHQTKISLNGVFEKANIQRRMNRKKPNCRFWIRPAKTDEW